MKYCFSLLLALQIGGLFGQRPSLSYFAEIKGVNFVAPRNPIEQQHLKPIALVNANYVGIVPYAFAYPQKPQINFDTSRQWWGERKEGTEVTIRYAQSLGLKVMLKPHVWVFGDGWPGEFNLDNEKDWKIWEQQYKEYVLTFAQLAQQYEVEVFCIGTEFRIAAVARRDFWVRLITDVRKVYKGKLTYAANWDNYSNITFWNYLDFIGIDAYFPLVESADPTTEQLKAAWVRQGVILSKFSQRWKKPVLFTEYGFQSMDHAAGKHWELDQQQHQLNLQLQSRAYQALYESLWDQPWFAGGFLWKWFAHHQNAGGPAHAAWTPQNKPAEQTIRKYYQNPTTD